MNRERTLRTGTSRFSVHSREIRRDIDRREPRAYNLGPVTRVYAKIKISDPLSSTRIAKRTADELIQTLTFPRYSRDSSYRGLDPPPT